MVCRFELFGFLAVVRNTTIIYLFRVLNLFDQKHNKTKRNILPHQHIKSGLSRPNIPMNQSIITRRQRPVCLRRWRMVVVGKSRAA
jgi:hypothetical protein